MKFRLFLSLFNLALVTALMAMGFSMSWFTATAAPPSPLTLLTGTVDIEITGEEAEPEMFLWEMSAEETSREFSWTVENTGTRDVYLRASLEESVYPVAAAWGEGSFFDPASAAGAMFFTFSPGGPAVTVNLIAGGDFAHPVGTVEVWQAGDTLYLEYSTLPGWQMAEAQVALAEDLAAIPQGHNGTPQPGRFPFQKVLDELVQYHVFELPLQGTYPDGALAGQSYDWTAKAEIYIAAHALVIGSEPVEAMETISWQPLQEAAAGDSGWQYNGEDGYWYYTQEPVAPGEQVSLSLTGQPLQQGVYSVKLLAEAVEAFPAAVDERWDSEIF